MLGRRTAAVLTLVAVATAGCAGDDRPPTSAGDPVTVAPTADPGEPAPRPTTESPVATPTTGTPVPPMPTAPFGAGDSFDLTSFAGLPVGTTLADFAAASGWTQDGCSAPGNALFVPASPAGDAAWWLFTPAYENEPDPDGDPQTWGIDEFALMFRDRPVAGRVGPVGPKGIQLGATATEVAAAFPDAERHEWVMEVDDPVVYDQRVVPAPDGTAMVIALVDGVVADIRWGSAAFADGFEGLYCF